MRNDWARGTAAWVLVCALGAAMTASAAAQAPAGGSTQRYSIEAQDLGSALVQLARQAKRNVLFDPALVANRRAPKVDNQAGFEATLRALLAGTGFRFEVSSDGTVMVLAQGASLQAPTRPAVQPRNAALDHPVEEIIITANKRIERLREAPISVTALGRAQLERLDAVRFEDYLNRVPGVSTISTGQGATQITLRGVTSGVQPNATVGIYIDETPFSVSNIFAQAGVLSADLDPYDMQRIEVLRGPQGTLYGASTLGGLLKYVSTPPDLSGFASRVQVQGSTVAGGGAGYGAKAMVNAPVSDQVAFRASAYQRHDPGYVDDPTRSRTEFNKTKVEGGRAAILFQPNERFDARLSVLAQNSGIVGGAVDLALPSMQPLYGAMERHRLLDDTLTLRYRLYNLTMRADFGSAELTSSTSFSGLHAGGISDVTPQLGDLLGGTVGVRQDATTDHSKATQELRLSSTDENRVDWLVGLFGTHERTDAPSIIPAFDKATGAPIPGFPLIGGQRLAARFTEVAAFGSATWHATPTVDITLGARISRNKQHFTNTLSGLLANPANPSQVQLLEMTSEDSSFTYLINPRWKPTDDLMVYGRIAKGYRPGGPNVFAGPASANVPANFGPDSLVNYEIGVKASFLDKKLTVDLSAFYIDWTNVQLTVVNGNFSYMGNGGAAVSKGGEWTIAYQPIHGMMLGLSGGYIQAQLTKDAPGVGGLKGDRQPTVPLWSISSEADYEWALADGWNANVGASWRYVGSRMSAYSLIGTRLRNPAYELVDLRAGVARNGWSLALNGKNVANKQAFANLSYINATRGTGTYLQPRTWLLTAAASF